MIQRNFNIDRRRAALTLVGLLALGGASVGVWHRLAAGNSPVINHTMATSRLPVAAARSSSKTSVRLIDKQAAPSRNRTARATHTSGVAAASLRTPAKETSIPRWAQGQVVRQVPVQRSDKVIALTFDDGPWPRYTQEVLQVLASRNVKATFFMVGQEVQRRPDLVREAHDAGHVIGNHSWGHTRKPRSPADEIVRTDAAIKKAIGVESTLFRPPYGDMKNGMAARARREGQCVVIWSADSSDWKRATAHSIAERVLRQARPGGIALMHDGGGDRGSTVAALPRIIDTLRKRGYRFVTVPELLALRHTKPKKSRSKPNSKKAVTAGKTLRAGGSPSLLAKR
jgi:peptidoglycan/xylan/chitin deacetylase (PgdA/CDA1 family)